MRPVLMLSAAFCFGIAFTCGLLEQRYLDVIFLLLARTYEHFSKGNPLVDTWDGYQQRVQATRQQYLAMDRARVTLTAEAHRHVWGTTDINGTKLDLSQYVHILGVDREALTIDVEGRIRFTDVLTYLLNEHRMTLEIIPDMVHLTVGGLYAGIGSGAAAFRYGALHHSVVEVDVLTSGGEVLTCSATSRPDLFALLPGSLGTLGYVLRMRLRIRTAGRYVLAKHTRLPSSEALIHAFEEKMSANLPDFLDGAIYSATESLLIEGKMYDEKPADASLYSLKSTGVPYAIAAREGEELWFGLLDFIYKWDPDGYFSTWETPGWTRDSHLRRFAANILPWMHRSDWLREAFSVLWQFDLKKEGSHMYADYVVPLQSSVKSLEWFDKEVGLYPLYLAPVNVTSPPLAEYALWNCKFPSVDIGVGYGPMGSYRGKPAIVRTRNKMERHFGKVEGGTRLQSTNIDLSNITEFWKLFPAGARGKYEAAKAAYDAEGVFPDLVDKLSSGLQKAGGAHNEFLIQNVLDGKYIDVWGGHRSHGSYVGTLAEDNCLWLISDMSGAATTIQNAQTGAYLSAWLGSEMLTFLHDKSKSRIPCLADVRMSLQDLGDASRWKIQYMPEEGDAVLIIRSVLVNKYLTCKFYPQHGGSLLITTDSLAESSRWRVAAFEL
mmetsp:Transcript_80645/g.147524  ORF Transcript_80645/g.147524 Transcript_80645/m.147524 type:complete len:663 (-) Transcript_80645:105-2093(-)